MALILSSSCHASHLISSSLAFQESQSRQHPLNHPHSDVYLTRCYEDVHLPSYNRESGNLLIDLISYHIIVDGQGIQIMSRNRQAYNIHPGVPNDSFISRSYSAWAKGFEISTVEK